MQPEDIKKEAVKIAEQVGETDGKPISQIELLIEKCGLEFVQKIAEETNKIEEGGGMKTHDRKRRRTKGGVFFFLAKGRMEASIRQEIFPNFGKHTNGEVLPLGIDWEERLQHFEPLKEEAGQVNNLTVTLIGRPGKIAIEGSTVMTVINQIEVKSPPYPKGVPPLESTETQTIYYVFMGLKHWQKIESAMEDDTDMMIIEGTSVYDTELGGIALLATSVSTKGLERQKRLAESQEAEQAKPKEQKAEKSKDKKATKEVKATTKAPANDNFPPSVATKLQQLYSAADTYRHKIANMEAKGQKTGLDMTKRLLENTEKQISALEQQYNK